MPKSNRIDTFNLIQFSLLTLYEFYSNCDRLDVLVFKVPASQRPNSKMRVDQLKYDIRHLQVNAIVRQSSLYNRII